MDGTGKREIVSGLSNVFALSLDHNNHVCWGQEGKGQRTVLSWATMKYAAPVYRHWLHITEYTKTQNISLTFAIYQVAT